MRPEKDEAEVKVEARKCEIEAFSVRLRPKHEAEAIVSISCNI